MVYGRSVRVILEWRGESIEVPELFSRLTVNQDAPPVPHNIVEKGLVYAPAYNVPPVITLDNTQAWARWMERFGTSPGSPREFIDKLNEIRESLEPARLVIESDRHETYRLPQDFMTLINIRQYHIENGEEDDIYYFLDFYEFEEHEMKTLDIQTSGNETSVAPSEPSRVDERPPTPRSHEVIAGESLTKIARKYGQPDRAWQELYELNKEVIHSQGNQSLIFPGQVFQLPEAWR